MPRPVKLAADAVSAGLSELPGWSLKDGKLHRVFEFPDFTRAFGFMAAVATVAEKLDHHPDWTNVYNRVTVNLETHDQGGITELDLKLAAKMNELAAGSQ